MLFLFFKNHVYRIEILRWNLYSSFSQIAIEIFIDMFSIYYSSFEICTIFMIKDLIMEAIKVQLIMRTSSACRCDGLVSSKIKIFEAQRKYFHISIFESKACFNLFFYKNEETLKYHGIWKAWCIFFHWRFELIENSFAPSWIYIYKSTLNWNLWIFIEIWILNCELFSLIDTKLCWFFKEHSKKILNFILINLLEIFQKLNRSFRSYS